MPYPFNETLFNTYGNPGKNLNMLIIVYDADSAVKEQSQSSATLETGSTMSLKKVSIHDRYLRIKCTESVCKV